MIGVFEGDNAAYEKESSTVCYTSNGITCVRLYGLGGVVLGYLMLVRLGSTLTIRTTTEKITRTIGRSQDEISCLSNLEGRAINRGVIINCSDLLCKVGMPGVLLEMIVVHVRVAALIKRNPGKVKGVVGARGETRPRDYSRSGLTVVVTANRINLRHNNRRNLTKPSLYIHA